MSASQNQPATLVGDREMAAARVFEAPRELVFKVFTDPKHIAEWWGPVGFATTTFKHELKPGGVWRFVMHGPDGRDYENIVTYLEVAAPEKLVYKHGGDVDVKAVNFTVTIRFEALGPKLTKVYWQSIFTSPDALDHVVKNYGALQGLDDTINRLGEQLKIVGTVDEPFVISRTFDAPRELVWKAWTERDRLIKWFGPKGFNMPHATLDFRPGGVFHYMMNAPDGMEMWAKFVYREIVPQQRIVWINAFSNKDGGLGRHPLAPEWPQQMLTMATFAEHEGKTTVTIQSKPHESTESERRIFRDGHSSMTMGWTGTFDQLESFLKNAN